MNTILVVCSQPSRLVWPQRHPLGYYSSYNYHVSSINLCTLAFKLWLIICKNNFTKTPNNSNTIFQLQLWWQQLRILKGWQTERLHNTMLHWQYYIKNTDQSKIYLKEVNFFVHRTFMLASVQSTISCSVNSVKLALSFFYFSCS